MAIKSLFEGGVSGKLFLDRRQFYPDPQEVAELWSNMFPFTTVLEQLETKKVDDPLYKMFENESSFYKQQFSTTTAATIAADGSESGAYTISNIVGLPTTVDDYYKGIVFEVWDSTLATLKGVVFCSSVTGGQLKFKTLKGVAVTTVSGDLFLAIGKLRGEGHVAPLGFQKELNVVWNSTALITESCELTGDLFAAAKLRGYSSDMAYQRQEMFKRYKNWTEQTLLKSVSVLGTNMDGGGTFSEASLRTLTDSEGASGVVRSTYGYIPILRDYGITWTSGAMDADTNIFKFNKSTVTYNDFIGGAEIIFDKRDNDEALAFAGRGAITTIAQRVADGDKKFGWAGKFQLGDAKWNTIGFSMRALETPHGVLWLVPTKSLRHAYNQTMVIPNLEHIGVAVFRPDEYKNNVKTDNDYDGVKDSIKSSKGIWMRLLKSHHMVQFV